MSYVSCTPKVYLKIWGWLFASHVYKVRETKGAVSGFHTLLLYLNTVYMKSTVLFHHNTCF